MRAVVVIGLLVLAVFCLVLAAACDPQRAAAGAAETTGAVTEPLAMARRIALAPPDGRDVIDQAIADAQERVRHHERKADFWVALGRAWARKARAACDPGYYAQAEACAQVALELEPDAPLALDLSGLVLLSHHRFAEARALAERVIAKRPDDPMAYGTLSDAELELGHSDEAVRAAERMVELKPDLPSYSRAAYLHWLKGDVETSIKTWRLAIDAASGRDPEPRAWALTETALVFFHQGDYDGAEAGFELALKTRADYPPALVGEARVAIARGALADARTLLERADRASPLAETAWLLGEVRARLGDETGAEAAFSEMRRRGRRGDRRTFALFLAEHDHDTALALTLIDEELKGRGDLYTHDARAFVLYRAGRLTEARAESNFAMRLGTRDARLWFHAGAIRVAAGESAGGQALIRRALAKNPAFDLSGVAEAKELLGTP